MNSDDQRLIFDDALSKNTALQLDWKFSVEDIVFNIKSTIPNLDIKCAPERQIKGNWTQTMILGGKKYQYLTESDSLINDVITTVNHYLEDKGITFVFYDTKDDNQNYLLIDRTQLKKYLGLGFQEVK